MKTWIIGLSLATLAAGSAYAVDSQRGHADRDGTLTRAEAEARAGAMFARRDANKDGKIDASDRAARKAARFDAIDADKNGQISRAEFTAERPHRMKGRETGLQGDRSKGEHRMGGGGHRGHRGGMVGGGMMGARADADKDGAVTQAEFTAAAVRRFDRIDANKDGQVTKEERQALRSQMREQWRERAGQRGAEPAQPAN